MFTGIIEELGTVAAIESKDDSAVITVDAKGLVDDLGLGGSLAVNGVCLTSVRTGDGSPPAHATAEVQGAFSGEAAGAFTAEVMGETLRLTGLGALRTGDRVNLERCTPASGRFDGHVVQGHVDGCGELISRDDHAEWSTLRIGIPNDLAPYTAIKGSIALNGVSLTLTAVSEPSEASAWVEVGLIPATLSHTTFGDISPGDPVNIEVDVLAKYTARLLSFRNATTTFFNSTDSTRQGADHD
ncbi:MAG: riboflavin synthase [Brevibacterium sp.]|uniref:riboflavin synthase n=1 Tax=Brevibacterium sp. TaxID=1701 RepID=UPI0026491307|nr:riboflavin synthase [Brevibacterium sp.]MDN6135116.1 riboflavin synthase [Brevibacterium sp.]MDN6158757.1 riboflavin synthase [Brevibacterium sp.]MDN6176703.1 riboflavin synthase [Brevibacterium sp.]MDN6188682.1 riboflavin synthase [Brevibacterium sp.]MDN6191886.1 riboflavin synthase [Brevibacterium sp.]